MKRILSSLIAMTMLITTAAAQYAPQAGVPGSTAVHKNSGVISNWATGCSVVRGYQNINDQSAGFTTSGSNASGIGAADGDVVSLGDSGVAVLTFALPIRDEAGADFAVFENGFLNPANSEEGYLELAFVEVSSDGLNYYRFPAASTTQTTTQIAGAGQYMQARNIDQLAGKYVGSYGTPFDLSDLSGIPGLNVEAISHVRIIDVIGSIGSPASRDDSGRIINDPFPTPFPTGGFDLDGVAVLHGTGTSVLNGAADIGFSMYPQPTAGTLHFSWNAGKVPALIASVVDMTGRTVLPASVLLPAATLSLSDLPDGFYFLKLTQPSGMQWIEKVHVRY